MRQIFVILIVISLLVPLPVFAVDQAELMKKIDQLSQELENLKKQMQEMQKKEEFKEERITQVEKKTEAAVGWPSWIEIGGDYRARYDYLDGKVANYMQYNPFSLFQPAPGYPYFFASPVSEYSAKNDALLTNRFGLNIKAKATEDIQFKGRLLMYKVWGHETSGPVDGNYFADRAFGPFDGTVGHVPQDNVLRVDRAYVTWSNIADLPVWFSIGRRPSTDGTPAHLRLNTEPGGTAGVPCFLVNYAFDGLTLGVAPDIPGLPGSYIKFCYGKGYDSGFETPSNSVKDVNFVGFNIVPIDTDNLHIELQWNRGMDIFNVPPDGFPQKIDTGLMAGGPPSGSYITVNTPVSTNLGDIDQIGALVLGKIRDVGPGDLSLFGAFAMSFTHPNDNLFSLPFYCMDATCSTGVQYAGYGLLYNQGSKESRTGNMIYLGARYDIKGTGTKLGLEYNHGSKYWITFAPAADDPWTSKLGTRGDVFEGYVIQELKLKPISKFGKAFFRLGYQYYSFDYTGSNNWVGAPVKISDLNMYNVSQTQLLAPVKHAHDIYLTFDVVF